MERWRGKIAVVTGASSGIGWQISKDLVKAGMNVVGLARRVDTMNSLRSQLSPELQSAFHPYVCDVASVESVKCAFAWISQQFQRMHVLINNAGMLESSKLLDEGNEESLKRVIDVNLMGTVYCTKEAYVLMKRATAMNEECHIINVNSLLGHTIPIHIPDCGFNLYPVSKHAMRATNEVLRRELQQEKLIRLSNISPGLTKTDFGVNGSKDPTLEKLPHFGDILEAKDVSQGLLYILGTPLHVTVAELMMVPSSEKY